METSAAKRGGGGGGNTDDRPRDGDDEGTGEPSRRRRLEPSSATTTMSPVPATAEAASAPMGRPIAAAEAKDGGVDTKTGGSSSSKKKRSLSEARRRHAELHGPPISFVKRRSGGANHHGTDKYIGDDGRAVATSSVATSTSAAGGGGVGGGITAASNPYNPNPTAAAGTGSSGSGNPFGLCTNVSARYEKLGRIGQGTYGTVYRARDKVTREVVALKRCYPHHEASDGFPVTTLREVGILREMSALGHPSIVHLREVAVSSSRSGVFLVFEYCDHDLADLVDTHYGLFNKSPFREGDVKRLTVQLLSALSFLHSRHVLHRDVKLSNLLYNHRGQLKLADFGLARRASLRRTNAATASPLLLRRVGRSRRWTQRRGGRDLRGTEDAATAEDGGGTAAAAVGGTETVLTPKVVSLWYRPPELLLGGEEYDEGCDNWGAGCVVGELLSGVPLIKGRNEMDQISKMFALLGPPSAYQWPGLSDMPLIKSGSLAIPNPPSRLTSSGGGNLLDRFSYLPASGLSLLSGFLAYDFKRRLTAKEGLKSKYFEELPAPTGEGRMPTFPSTGCAGDHKPNGGRKHNLRYK